MRALPLAVVMLVACACGSGSGGDGKGPGPGPGPGPGGAGGGQIGGGTQGGTGTPVPAAGESSYWLQGTSRKVQPTTHPPAMGGSAALEGARGAVESVQIVLRGPLNVTGGAPSDLSDGAGNVIPAADVQLFREDFIDFTGVDDLGGTLAVPSSSPTHDGRVPDPLIPFHDPYTGSAVGVPFTVAAGENQPVWVDVRIPADQAYGIYTGSISFPGTGVTVPVSVTVWDITLPDMRAVTAWFQLDYNVLGDYHAGVRDCYYASCAPGSAPREIIRRYQQLLHEHRLDAQQPLVAGPGGCGTPTASDWASFDAGIASYMDGSYFDDGVPGTILSAPFTPHGEAWGPPGCGQAQVKAAARAWADHLKAKGWFDRTFVYAQDEPPEEDLPAIATQAGWLDEADPEWRAHILDTVAATPSTTATLDGVLGIYVTCVSCFDEWGSQPGYERGLFGRAQWPARLEQGWRFWLYESNAQGPPFPGFASNTLDAGEPRILLWGSWYEGATGFLYWSVNAWDGDDPWGPNVRYAKTGDGVLVYPGDHSGENAGQGSPAGISVEGPIPSLRLKTIRAGMQDWALFLLADRNGLHDRVRTEVSSVYSRLGGCDWTGCPGPPNGSWYWRTDDDLMTAARRRIAEAMLATR